VKLSGYLVRNGQIKIFVLFGCAWNSENDDWLSELSVLENILNTIEIASTYITDLCVERRFVLWRLGNG
jgi:hypothetical protein